MSLQPLPDFQSFPTHHCVTGSLRHIFAYHDHPMSEEMLLGLGEGVGFVYWHQKGAPPFYGGRANIRSPRFEGLPITAGRRTGVRAEWHATSSARKAEKSLLALLAAGEPVMIHLDMGYLPYFPDLPDDFHFGYHVVVVAGYDPETGKVLLADRDTELHPVSAEVLAQARGSTYKPFPPKHQYYTFDFTDKQAPTPAGINAAIQTTAERMVDPPISNLGVRGIRKARQRTRQWPREMDAEALRWACFNAFIYIDASGGTGGGIFRYMYARFLDEAAEITNNPRLRHISQEFCHIGDMWQEVAHRFQQAAESDDPASQLEHITAPMPAIAGREETAWRQLGQMCAGD
jgi:hypothetical protein